jgi:hypothetical protein
MNTATLYKCFSGAGQTLDSNAANAAVSAITQTACTQAGGVWLGYTHSVPAPECREAPWSRENHLGNTKSDPATTPLNPVRYRWKLPSIADLTGANTKAKLYTATDGACALLLLRWWVVGGGCHDNALGWFHFFRSSYIRLTRNVVI